MRALLSTTVAVVLFLCALAPGIASAAEEHTAEIMEWIIEPCMEVAVAIEVKNLDRDTLATGVKRSHLAKIMSADREAAARRLAKSMKKGATWKQRSDVYPAMLRMCIRNIKGWKSN